MPDNQVRTPSAESAASSRACPNGHERASDCGSSRTCKGNGYGTEACSLAIDYVFDVHPHPAVRAKVLPDNDASRGLLESLGFTQEGRARRDAFWNGEYRDAVLYGLLREEWRDGD